jgi:hypothetical protein
MKKRYKLAIAVAVAGMGFSNIGAKSAQAAVATFEGIDPGVDAGQSRPNSDSAAALFDQTAGALGIVNKIDFENLPVTNSTSLTVAPGITANWLNQGDNTIEIGGNQGFGYNTTSGGSKYAQVFANNTRAAVEVTFSFANPIQAFGGYFTGVGNFPGDTFINFTDGTWQSLALSESSLGGVQFLGFIDSDKLISSVTVRENPEFISGVPFLISGDRFGIDDIRYVNSSQSVPEPMTIGGILAASGLGWLMKRKHSFS